MKKNSSSMLRALLAFLLMIPLVRESAACSMYKITADGKTIVGCNEDAWRTTPRVWFEIAEADGEYGAGFTGSRLTSRGPAPQSGMNEAGLVFSRLAAYHPTQANPFLDRKPIQNEVDYLTSIMHTCATVEEVREYIRQYDHSIFYDHVFIYIDHLGNYLIVEPYRLIDGDSPNYLLSNFCPSITSPEQSRELDRYRNGEDFLSSHQATTSLAYCTALSEAMHVCRSRNGDGTLLTSIWDTKDRQLNLYFYHSYDSAVQFDLAEELAKGNHMLGVPELFPKNEEFERFGSYKTPYTDSWLRLALVGVGGGLACFTFLMGILSFNRPWAAGKSFFSIAVLNSMLIVYLGILATHMGIYYFDAPYKEATSNWVSASSYMPFLLLLAIFPFGKFIWRQSKSRTGKGWVSLALLSNGLMYLLLIAAFSYWGLYDIWS